MTDAMTVAPRRLERNQAPPPHYYAEKIALMLDGVERQYSDLLDATERRYIAGYRSLGTAAQRLHARLVSRKGPLYRVDTLQYREVGRVDQALEELVASSLVDPLPSVPADLWLRELTRDELRALFPRAAVATKRHLVDTIAASRPDAAIRARVSARHPAVARRDGDLLERMQILFFGGTRDLSTFVLEDLGVLRFEGYLVSGDARAFPDRAAFDRYLALDAARARIADLEAAWDTRAAHALLDTLAARSPARLVERRRGRLLNRLGHTAERAGQDTLALAAYAASEQPPARERRVRILSRLGRRAEAVRELDGMRRSPRAAIESAFAAAFDGRRIRRAPPVPETRLRLAQPPARGVERAALAALLANGGSGRHLENTLPLSLLGLAFWDVVFMPVEGAFVNAYQDRPLDLYWEDFRSVRSASIASRLHQFGGGRGCDRALSDRVRATYRDKRGTRNALVAWNALDEAFLNLVTAAIPASCWRAIFDHLLSDLAQFRTGFPDLTLVYGRERFEFVEVKGPGDQMRREQRLWFDFFARAGLPARLLRVEW